MLALSRDQVRTALVELSELLAGVVDDNQIEAGARPCRLVLDAPAGLRVRADPELLRRAVENVLRNGIRYAAPDTEVRLTARRAGARMEITVQDAGPGVPDNARGQIFAPFYRVEPDRDRSTGGAGLGLPIARRAVELHGGVISAANTRPGLRVTISLPV